MNKLNKPPVLKNPNHEDQFVEIVLDYGSNQVLNHDQVLDNDNDQNQQTPSKSQLPPLLSLFKEILLSGYLPNKATDPNKSFYHLSSLIKDATNETEEYLAFYHYKPHLNQLNYEQFCSYIAFRTQLKKGNLVTLPYSYLEIYFSELINTFTPNNYNQFLTDYYQLWTLIINQEGGYRTLHSNYLKQVILDVYIHLDINTPYYQFLSDYKFNELDYKLNSYNFSYTVNYLSLYYNFNITYSAFIIDYGKDKFINIINQVLATLNRIAISKQLTLADLLFNFIETPYHPFRDFYFYPQFKLINKTVKIDETIYVIYANNRWEFTQGYYNKTTGLIYKWILKSCENVLRKFSKARSLPMGKIDISNTIFGKFFKTNQIDLNKVISSVITSIHYQREIEPIELNYDLIDKIKQESLEIQARLIVNDEIIFNDEVIFNDEIISNDEVISNDITPSLKAEINNEDDININININLNVHSNVHSNSNPSFITQLNPIQLTIIKMLLDHKSTKELTNYLSSHHQMLTIVIEEINNLAFDYFNDIIIEETSQQYIIFNEYYERIKAMVTT